MAAHLVLQLLAALAGLVPAAADIDEHLVRAFAAAVALGEHAVQRLVRDLGDGVPHRDLDRADADRALAVAAGFLVAHHRGEDFVRAQDCRRASSSVSGSALQDARDEALAHLRAAGIAAGRIEGEAGDRLAAAHHVGDHRDHRRRHFREIEARIGERRLQRDRGFADIDNAHVLSLAGHSPSKTGVNALMSRPSRLGGQCGPGRSAGQARG